MILFVFQWVRRIEIFKWCWKFSLKLFIHLSCENFQTKVLSLKSYSKEFSSLNLHSKEFTKVLSNPTQIGPKSQQPFIPFSLLPSRYFYTKNGLEIRSYLSINFPLFLFCLITLLQPPKCYSRSGVPVSRCYALL